MFKIVKLSNIIKNTNANYFVIELKYDNATSSCIKHFPHAIVLTKLSFFKITTIVDKNSRVVVNMAPHTNYFYYHELKRLGYKKVYLLKWNIG